MAESIQKQGKELSIVIYDAPLPPKYFRLSKKFVHTLFFTIPIFFVFLLSSFFLWGIYGRLEKAPRPTLPKLKNEHEVKIKKLSEELAQIRASHEKLTQKLTLPSSPTAEDGPYLLAINRPYGMQNLQDQNRVTLDHFQLSQGQGKVALKFQIINSMQEKKIYGHVIVFMISSSGIVAYPREAHAQISTGIKFNLGEPFAVSRLRPTLAEFEHVLMGDTVKFTIYIFNREGDLLLIKDTPPFKVEVRP